MDETQVEAMVARALAKHDPPRRKAGLASLVSGLSGSKTYIIAVALAALAAAQYLEYVTPEMATTIGTLLVGGGLAALRAGSKTEADTVKATVAVVAGRNPERVAETVAVAEKRAGG